ncbi:MAG: hypothetical protein PVJ86_02815, partial [Phycisphaerales bacterium]
LYRINGKAVRIRGVFGHSLIAEIFSTVLKWEPITLPKRVSRDPGSHTQRIVELLNETKLILGDGNI